METKDTVASGIVGQLPWIEPAVTQLDVRDTRQNCGRGSDLEYTLGGNKYPDCTRS